MAMVSASRSLFISFLLASLILVSSERVARPPAVRGLDYDFYWLSCPRIERIVRKHLEDVFEKDSGQAPGILRLFFHDCFSQVFVRFRLLDQLRSSADPTNDFGVINVADPET